MTFQNFLSRVTKWNQTIIDEETARILTKSGCSYLEDLLTCVHITQLKILTSIRVSQKQKKIELDIPKLSEFIHKTYIKCARKFYSNVYLFEQKIPPLQYQKNMRECETICKDCILDVIRDNMPVEHILRSYMDESVEEEVIEEQVAKTQEEIAKEEVEAELKIQKDVQDMKNLIKKGGVKDASGTSEVVAPVVAAVAEKPAAPAVAEKPTVTAAAPAAAVAEKPTVTAAAPAAAVAEKPTVTAAAPAAAVAEKPTVTAAAPAAAVAEKPTVTAAAVAEKPAVVATPVLKVETAVTPSSAPTSPQIKTPVSPLKRSLSFNDVDKVFDHETLEEKAVSAPKTIDRLEEISKMRTAQRKAEDEEEDEDAFKISGAGCRY